MTLKSYCVDAEWPDPFEDGNVYERFFFDADTPAEAKEKAIYNIMREDFCPAHESEIKTTVRRAVWE